MENERDPASNQLQEWKKKNENGQECRTSTDTAGIPIESEDTTITLGPRGPITMYDRVFFDELAHMVRERIPERVVHAKGAGAHGYFECTDDISDLTIANVFEVGKSTPIMVRFSRVITDIGSADTVRDLRGFAIKFYTEQGNWDLVGNNTPIFFVRDPKSFQWFVHSQKRNPVTNLRDWDMYWDFLSLSEQSIHQTLILFTDRGIPNGYRHMHGYGSHTFSLINQTNEITYVKFHFLTDQGIENILEDEANIVAGEDPDYAIRDLYNAIAREEYPSWTFYIQTMTLEQVKKCTFDPFDITKVWPHGDYPLKRVGKLVLNRNPMNYFAEVEQLTFNPANMIPGIGPSPDRFLQGRLFAYGDAGRYRVGTNAFQLPINSPFKWCNYLRDGNGIINNQNGAPNYYPNSFNGPEPESPTADGIWAASGEIHFNNKLGYFDVNNKDNYSQPRTFVTQTLSEEKRTILIENLANSLKKVSKKIRERAIKNFERVDSKFGREIRSKIELNKHAKL